MHLKVTKIIKIQTAGKIEWEEAWKGGSRKEGSFGKRNKEKESRSRSQSDERRVGFYFI